MADKVSKYLKETEKQSGGDKEVTKYYDEMIDQWEETKKTETPAAVVAKLERKYINKKR